MTQIPKAVRCFRYLFLAALIFWSSEGILRAEQRYEFDLVVYGATPSGIIAAVAAAREGEHVAIVEPSHFIGGMVASGLSYSDIGNPDVIGGISREFFERVGRHYNEPIEWDFEPHVASQVFEDMLREARVRVFLDSRLLEHKGVEKKNGLIVAIRTENGESFAATEFIDASYEGDVMAEAGVSFTWGRESAAQYGESLAGVNINSHPDHRFNMWVSPYTFDGALLAGVSSSPRGELGQGDKKIPAYNYRLCFTADKQNQVPYPKPDGYDPKQYELLFRYIQGLTDAAGHPPRIGRYFDLMMMEPIKGDKLDINNLGAFSTDDIGANWDYPTASYRRRKEIADEIYRYDAGFFYFLAHDPRIPPELQNKINQYGLCKDEFTSTHNWPWQLYVREDRRMLGEYVMTQHDVLENRTKPDSIGLGSYPVDSHNIQRVATPDRGVQDEGVMYFAPNPSGPPEIPPYEIPYRSIVPKRSDVSNLLVPVCLSASHVSYSTLRQEPQYMILGQAAGTAAAIAAHEHRAVQDVPIKELQMDLVRGHALLHWKGSTPPQKENHLN